LMVEVFPESLPDSASVLSDLKQTEPRTRIE